jgi:predicted MFS family arabinose efflux permease
MLAYVALAIGATFLSGAEDALFYESLQRAGLAGDYTRRVGRAGAILLGASALGSVASGLLATVDLILPFLVGGVSMLCMFVIVLTFKEAQVVVQSDAPAHRRYVRLLREAITLVRARPALRFPILYLAIVPLAAIIMETFFLQTQVVTLGIPIAGVGVVVLATQIANIAGSTWSYRIGARFGARRVLIAAPALIVCSLILLAALQVVLALLFIAAIGFLTSIVHPLALSRIQDETADDVRATILSLQSLLFAALLALGEPMLGLTADRAGLSAAYVALALGLGALTLGLFWFWNSRQPQYSRAASSTLLGNHSRRACGGW